MVISSNFFSFNLNKDEINIKFFNKDDNKDIKDLRKTYNHGYNFYLNKQDGNIYFWKKNNSVLDEISDKTKTINTKEHYWVINKILSESITNLFKDKAKYRIRYNKSFVTITLLEKDLSEGKFKGVKVFRNFELHFLPLQIKENYTLGVTVSISTSPRIVWNKFDFENNRMTYSPTQGYGVSLLGDTNFNRTY